MISALHGVPSPSSLRAMRPNRTAPAVCELLGLDPLDMACEGRLIVICPEHLADNALTALHTHSLGREARRIGTVVADDRCFVQMQTRLGGRRLVHWLSAEALPRIC